MRPALALLAAMLVLAGCGGATQPSSSPAAVGTTVASLSGFYLHGGQPAEVQFFLRSKTLRVLVVTTSPSLKCALVQRAATGGSQVRAGDIPMTETRRAYTGGGGATQYDFTTRSLLQPGWYQLTLSGHGQVWTLGAAEF